MLLLLPTALGWYQGTAQCTDAWLPVIKGEFDEDQI